MVSKQFPLSLPDDLKFKLREISERDDRAMAGIIRTAIRKYLEESDDGSNS